MKRANKLILLSLLCSVCALADDAEDTLVDEWDRVSDFDARQALTDILSTEKANAENAMEHLQLLLREKPNDVKTKLLLIKVLLHKKQYEQADKVLEEVSSHLPKDPQMVSELAQVYLAMGHVVEAKRLFTIALESAGDGIESVLLSYAGALQTWGDYPQAQCIYREYLQQHPDEIPIWRALAISLLAQERFAEVEQLYMQVLCKARSQPVLLDWARLKKIEKNFQAAQEIASFLDDSGKDREEILILTAEIAEKQERNQDAINIYLKLAREQKHDTNAADYLMRAYKLYRKDGCCEAAQELLAQAAALDPDSIAVRYYQGVELDDIIEEASSPQELLEWVGYYLDDECIDSAIALQQAALCLDPAHHYAKIGLAGLLPIRFRYEEAAQIYLELLQEFPDNPTYLLQYARVRSWDKQRTEAMLLYDLLILRYPDNPILYLEKARVAMWSQNGRLAMATYNLLLRERIDVDLLEALECLPDHEVVVETSSLLMAHLEQRSIYGGTDEAVQCLEVREKVLQGEACGPVESAIICRWAQYRTQKHTYLEMKAALAGWEGHFFESLCYMERLIAFEPGNQEMLFNYAEAWCSLGLCGKSMSLFHEIRRLDPLHNIVNKAIKQRSYLDSPAEVANYNVWSEVGRGDLSGITRHYFKGGLESTLWCPTKLRFTYDLFLDHTYINKHNFLAHALTLQYRDTYNKYLSAEGWFTGKFAGNYDIHGPVLWNARLLMRAADGLRWVVGTERRDEFYNYFGVDRGTQSTSIFTMMQCDLNRLLTLEGGAQYLDYSDHNHQNLAQLSVSYKLTEYPRVLRFLFQGDYRTFQYASEFVYDGETLVDIIHPYWTPQHYLAGRTGFEFYHDLTNLEFCGAQKQFYRINFMAVEDTEDNPGISLAVDLHWEWANRWKFSLNGQINHTRQWDGGGVRTELMYRF